ncbi:hypothetical protein [Paraburkholderia xenovorans]
MVSPVDMFADRRREEEAAARRDAGRAVTELRSYAALASIDWDACAGEVMRVAAAMIEGHVESFAVVVRDNAGLRDEVAAARRNHDGALEIIARWRELLVALRAEHPEDIRLKRALMGEHPMRLAAWERQP